MGRKVLYSTVLSILKHISLCRLFTILPNSVGIIGENKLNFNMRTLTPIGAENEDEENVDQAKEDATRRE